MNYYYHIWSSKPTAFIVANHHIQTLSFIECGHAKCTGLYVYDSPCPSREWPFKSIGKAAVKCCARKFAPSGIAAATGWSDTQLNAHISTARFHQFPIRKSTNETFRRAPDYECVVQLCAGTAINCVWFRVLRQARARGRWIGGVAIPHAASTSRLSNKRRMCA